MDNKSENVNSEEKKLSEDDIKKSLLKELSLRKNNDLKKIEGISDKIDNHNKDIEELPIKEQKKIKAEEIKKYILSLSPKLRFQKGFLPEGYHSGFTKPTLKSRTLKRRTNNKAARISRRKQNR